MKVIPKIPPIIHSVLIISALAFILLSMKYRSTPKVQVVITPGHSGLMTKVIQQAIDSCAANGGGIVRFQAGTYLSGGIHLKSNVTLWLEKNTILQGSSTYSDYANDAFIFGENLSSISIRGDGMIDGVDCFNPEGEEGFRGPHCIRLINCRNISLEEFTIKNSANWAINCRYCSNAKVSKVSIRGGHDGLHTRFCNNFVVSGCDFRTGDDAFAGNDNRYFVVSDCKINTSCNGFRMGCLNFTVKNCRLWGPGESVHKIQKRNNMLAAFVHFSPRDENPKVLSGNWLVENVTVENVDHFYVYNFQSGLWQTGQPATGAKLNNIKCKGLLSAFNIIGDNALKYNLSVENSSFSFREDALYNDSIYFEGVQIQSPAMVNASNFNRIQFIKVTLEKQGNDPVMNCSSGNMLILDEVSFIGGGNPYPLLVKNVKEIKKEKLKSGSGELTRCN